MNKHKLQLRLGFFAFGKHFKDGSIMVRESLQVSEILQKFSNNLKLIRGGENATVRSIQTGRTADTESLVFISTREQLLEAANSPARTWVVGKPLQADVPAHVTTVLVSDNPYLALANVAAEFFPQTRALQIAGEAAIHPTACIASSAKVGEGCRIGPGAVIGEGVELGPHCVIGANSVIEPDVKIGSRTRIHPLVFIGHGCVLGARCEVKPNTTIGGEGFGYAHDAAFNHYRVTHYGRVVLEDDVHIGAGVQIDRGTFEDSHFAAGAKIDNHCHFGHNIVVGKNTVITASMVTAGSTTIGANCVFGGRVTIKGHLSVADGCQFGGITAIGKTVDKRGEYGGFPMQLLKDEMKTRAALKNLPALIKRVRRIMKHLGLDDP